MPLCEEPTRSRPAALEPAGGPAEAGGGPAGSLDSVAILK